MPEDNAATALERLIERYLALWNEPDAVLRREAIAELWAEAGTYVSAQAEFRGHTAIDGAVGEAHDQLIGKGYVFTSANNGVGHHNTVRFNRNMVPAGGGPVAAIVFDFFLLDDAGRILADYQYIDKPPSF